MKRVVLVVLLVCYLPSRCERAEQVVDATENPHVERSVDDGQ